MKGTPREWVLGGGLHAGLPWQIAKAFCQRFIRIWQHTASAVLGVQKSSGSANTVQHASIAKYVGNSPSASKLQNHFNQ
jgi:hypothetical protein